MKTIAIFIIGTAAAIFISGCGSNHPPSWISGAVQNHKWGYYSGYPETRWHSDGRSMTLLNELRYMDPNGVEWVAPAGSRVDGASIPRTLWTFMGGPFEGKYRNASVLHDVAYEQKKRPWQECDRMFYNAMRCSGVGAVEAKTMYYSLVRFGNHWKFPIKRAKRPKAKELARQAEQSQREEYPRAIPADAQDIQGARDWIRGNDPSLEEIEQRAGTESPQ